MRRSKIAWVLVCGAGAAAIAMSGCSSDDDTVASGGASGHAGSAGAGGSHAGTGGGAGAGIVLPEGGAAGVAGEPNLPGVAGEGGLGGEPNLPGAAGEGGAAGNAGSGGEGGTNENPCGPSPLTTPTVASDIAVASSATLVAAYAAIGTQTYTCTATTVNTVTTYAWSAASVPSANLYSPACSIAATHYAGPHWKANDGSIILGTKVRSVASATANSIPQLLLSTVPDAGVTGLFSPVTAVQRLNTVGGVAPTTGCDSTTVSNTVAVPYTATYYFYSGANSIPPT